MQKSIPLRPGPLLEAGSEEPQIEFVEHELDLTGRNNAVESLTRSIADVFVHHRA